MGALTISEVASRVAVNENQPTKCTRSKLQGKYHPTISYSAPINRWWWTFRMDRISRMSTPAKIQICVKVARDLPVKTTTSTLIRILLPWWTTDQGQISSQGKTYLLRQIMRMQVMQWTFVSQLVTCSPCVLIQARCPACHNTIVVVTLKIIYKSISLLACNPKVLLDCLLDWTRLVVRSYRVRRTWSRWRWLDLRSRSRASQVSISQDWPLLNKEKAVQM